MATGTGSYVGGWEVTQNSDGSYNVPGIGVVGTAQSGATPTADSDAGSLYTDNSSDYANYYNSGGGGSDSTGYSGASGVNTSKSGNVASGGSGSGYVFIPPPLSNTTNTNVNTGLLNNTDNKKTAQTYTYTLDSDGNIIKVPSTTPLSSLTPAESSVNPTTGINNNNYFNGNGFAYTDPYGFGHVVNKLSLAQQSSGNGDVSAYKGAYGGGYALGSSGDRVFIPLPGAVAYGNDSASGANDQDYASNSSSSGSSGNVLTSSATVNRANALAKMLGTNNAVNTRYIPTDADVEALYLKQYGNANLPEATKAAVLKAMKIMMGGA